MYMFLPDNAHCEMEWYFQGTAPVPCNPINRRSSNLSGHLISGNWCRRMEIPLPMDRPGKPGPWITPHGHYAGSLLSSSLPENWWLPPTVVGLYTYGLGCFHLQSNADAAPLFSWSKHILILPQRFRRDGYHIHWIWLQLHFVISEGETSVTAMNRHLSTRLEGGIDLTHILPEYIMMTWNTKRGS